MGGNKEKEEGEEEEEKCYRFGFCVTSIRTGDQHSPSPPDLLTE